MILRLVVLLQYRLAMDKRTDRWTDRQTQDGSIYRASIVSRGNNGILTQLDITEEVGSEERLQKYVTIIDAAKEVPHRNITKRKYNPGHQ